MLRSLVRAHPFLVYYLLAFALASSAVVAQSLYAADVLARTGRPFLFNETLWDGLKEFGHGRLYANLISIGWVSIYRQPVYFTVFLYGGAPSLSALLTVWVGWGGDGLKRLLGRLKPWRSRAFRQSALVTYAVIAALFFVVSLGHLAIIAYWQGTAAALAAASLWGLPAILFPIPFLIGGLIDEGGTQEELGWRGFALPALIDKAPSPLAAALWLGFLWWFWHFPREIPDILAGKVVWATFLPGQAVFMGLVIAMSVGMTYAYNRTGSVIPGILLHGWGNFIGKGVGIYAIYKGDDRLWLWGVAAVLLVIFTRTSLGRDKYLAMAGALKPDEPAWDR